MEVGEAMMLVGLKRRCRPAGQAAMKQATKAAAAAELAAGREQLLLLLWCGRQEVVRGTSGDEAMLYVPG